MPKTTLGSIAQAKLAGWEPKQARLLCAVYDNGRTPGSSETNFGSVNFIRFSWPLESKGVSLYDKVVLPGQLIGPTTGWTPQFTDNTGQNGKDGVDPTRWVPYMNAAIADLDKQDKVCAAYAVYPATTWRAVKFTSVDPCFKIGTWKLCRTDRTPEQGNEITVFPVLTEESIIKAWCRTTEVKGESTLEWAQLNEETGEMEPIEHPTWQPYQGAPPEPIPYDCWIDCGEKFEPFVAENAVSNCNNYEVEQLCVFDGEPLPDLSNQIETIALFQFDCDGDRINEIYTWQDYLDSLVPTADPLDPESGQYVLPEDATIANCDGSEFTPPDVENPPCSGPFELREKIIAFPDTAAGCLKIQEKIDLPTCQVCERMLCDGTDVDALLDECNIELQYLNPNSCKTPDEVITDPGCPEIRFDGITFLNDVRYSRGPNQGQPPEPYGWDQGDEVSFPLKAGANYLSDIRQCVRLDQSCCLLNQDQSLPLTIRVTFDHVINPGNGQHTGFNVNPGPGTIVASSPDNTTSATIGGDEGVRANRWIDIEYTLGDLLSGDACWSTSALGTSNTLGEDAFPESYHETVYSVNTGPSPDFLSQLTDILTLCPCPNEEGRLSGLNAQAVGEKPGTPTEAFVTETLAKRAITAEVSTAGLTGGAPEAATGEQVGARTRVIAKSQVRAEDKAVAVSKQSLTIAKAKQKAVIVKKTESKSKTETKKG